MSFAKEYPIAPLNKQAMDAAQERLNSLIKPPGSLGELEAVSEKLAGISGEVYYNPAKRCIIIMSSDNGVVEEGVAAAPQGVTYAQTINFVKGITGVSVLAKLVNADLIVVDVGINADMNHPLIKNKKIRKSTSNIAKGPAMTREDAEKAVRIGIETAIQAKHDGYKLLGAGEMGIGNTTTSAAVLFALTGLSPDKAVGKGAGLKEDAYRNKIDVVRTAITKNAVDASDPIDVLAKVGGFDIAAMAGVYIGAAHMQIPIVIDGFISIVAALVAARINPSVKDYMFASHVSAEPGYLHAQEAIGLTPCLHLNMRLGEGSGCPLMFTIIDAACAIIKDMATFADLEAAEDYLDEVKDADFNVV